MLIPSFFVVGLMFVNTFERKYNYWLSSSCKYAGSFEYLSVHLQTQTEKHILVWGVCDVVRATKSFSFQTQIWFLLCPFKLVLRLSQCFDNSITGNGNIGCLHVICKLEVSNICQFLFSLYQKSMCQIKLWLNQVILIPTFFLFG